MYLFINLLCSGNPGSQAANLSENMTLIDLSTSQEGAFDRLLYAKFDKTRANFLKGVVTGQQQNNLQKTMFYFLIGLLLLFLYSMISRVIPMIALDFVSLPLKKKTLEREVKRYTKQVTKQEKLIETTIKNRDRKYNFFHYKFWQSVIIEWKQSRELAYLQTKLDDATMLLEIINSSTNLYRHRREFLRLVVENVRARDDTGELMHPVVLVGKVCYHYIFGYYPFLELFAIIFTSVVLLIKIKRLRAGVLAMEVDKETVKDYIIPALDEAMDEADDAKEAHRAQLRARRQHRKPISAEKLEQRKAVAERRAIHKLIIALREELEIAQKRDKYQQIVKGL